MAAAATALAGASRRPASRSALNPPRGFPLRPASRPARSASAPAASAASQHQSISSESTRRSADRAQALLSSLMAHFHNRPRFRTTRVSVHGATGVGNMERRLLCGEQVELCAGVRELRTVGSSYEMVSCTALPRSAWSRKRTAPRLGRPPSETQWICRKGKGPDGQCQNRIMHPQPHLWPGHAEQRRAGLGYADMRWVAMAITC